MKFIPFYLFLFSTLLVAQAQEKVGPNLNLGIDEMEISILTTAACLPQKSEYIHLKYFTPFEQIILELEGHDEASVTEMLREKTMNPFEIIRNVWNTKWSKVYCLGGSKGLDGYMDIILLSSGQFQTVRNIYNTNWGIKSNINRLVNLNPYQPVAENPMTLLDMVDKMIDEKWGQMTYSQSLVNDIRLVRQDLIKYGARKANELSAEELKLELERARKEGKY